MQSRGLRDINDFVHDVRNRKDDLFVMRSDMLSWSKTFVIQGFRGATPPIFLRFGKKQTSLVVLTTWCDLDRRMRLTIFVIAQLPKLGDGIETSSSDTSPWRLLVSSKATTQAWTFTVHSEKTENDVQDAMRFSVQIVHFLLGNGSTSGHGF